MTSSGGESGETGAVPPSMTVCSWNVNNRVGKTTFRPEAAAAAMETDADVLVFNEFFPKDALPAFRANLTAGGWAHQTLSITGAVKANRIFVASRYPVTAVKLPASTVDEHLTSNALSFDIGVFRLLAIRVPAYESGQERRDAFTWLAGVADELQQAGRPSMIFGDLNTSMTATGSRRIDAFHALLENGWDRAQPEGVGSFVGKRGWCEIDHVLATEICQISDARYVSKTESYELAGTAASLSDHAALVFRVKAMS